MATATTTSPPEPMSPVDRALAGKDARARVPRSSHADWGSTEGRTDPLDILARQATTRVADLVPIRHGRMAATAFSFYRGAAAVMASDLASRPSSGLEVQLCGDAHLSNFGGFASPERSMVFDVNDFDETYPGPFEWDVKRLAASLEVAGRARDLDTAERARVVSGTARSYRKAVRSFATQPNLDVWYARLDQATATSLWGSRLSNAAIARLQRAVQKARSKDRLKAKAKLTQLVDGELRFLSQPPLLVPASELFPEADFEELRDTIGGALRSYRSTLSGENCRLLDGYRFVDLARKVVGVGSVGTRCWIALLVGRDDDDPLFLQVKEAEASVLEPFLGAPEFENQGERVVEGQRLTQAASDIFLGWERVDGLDGRTHDYYLRQLWDWKASADIDSMDRATLGVYGKICGWVLARAHARSGDAIAIGAYLGSGESFDRAIVEFAQGYADRNELDHQRLVDQIAAGEVPALAGV